MTIKAAAFIFWRILSLKNYSFWLGNDYLAWFYTLQSLNKIFSYGCNSWPHDTLLLSKIKAASFNSCLFHENWSLSLIQTKLDAKSKSRHFCNYKIMRARTFLLTGTTERNRRRGSYLYYSWKCSLCATQLGFDNCHDLSLSWFYANFIACNLPSEIKAAAFISFYRLTINIPKSLKFSNHLRWHLTPK